MRLEDILRDSNYKLSQFTLEEINWLEGKIFLKPTRSGDKPYVQCLVRNKDIQLKPEEVVRQLYLKVLCDRYGYPLDRMIVEYPVKFGTQTKKADIAIMDKDRPKVPYIIVEVKKPKEKDGKDQLKSYCNGTGAPIGVWTNGDAISRWHRMDPNYFERITDIPKANQTLEDILQIKFTLEDLIANDRLVQEKMSLRALIEEMEDEVLANAGVDVFEEVFKLIFTKLYDEWLSGQGKNRSKRLLEFRNTGQTEGALKSKIQDLFDAAKDKWEGVFSEDSKISLTPSHLAVCVRSLENVKLFNSNLDVIDEAFEYLVNQSSKGEKGQYFTPRYVIDMCVKMLNPQEDEYMIDTAAGSSGFPVHTIFHVWKQILEDEGLEASHLFTIEHKPQRCTDYVEKKVFAIDFDEKSVRVARTLNLIAGDGQTNVLHLNTLDFDLWDEAIKEEHWNDTYNNGFKRMKKLRADKKSYKEFQFDVLMANPPFAGDIKESRIIARYDLAKKPNGQWQTKVGRDILFIERNLDFLKPGGRMAIVLPQGRFNNSSDKQIRDYIAERCRILAVVGLHGNTFKPHTGTKTSVLFVQKWNDDPKAGVLCPRQDDYNIFFATMRKSGKDNSGDKIYRTIPPPKLADGLDDGSDGKVIALSDALDAITTPKAADATATYQANRKTEPMLDQHDHLVIDHDLFNHDGLTEDGIVEAFIEFAKKENLSFFESGPSVTLFDEKRYRQLMDGLAIREVKLQEMIGANRLDAEFAAYSEIQWLVSLQRKHIFYPLANFLDYISSGHTPYKHDVHYGGIKFITVECIGSLTLDDKKLKRIERKHYEKEFQKNRVAKNTIVCTIKRRIGKSYPFLEEPTEPMAMNQDVAILVPKKNVSPAYLATYLNSRVGQSFCNRQKTEQMNPYMSVSNLSSLPTVVLQESFQYKIEQLVKKSYYLFSLSRMSYQEAEDLLLSELGLEDWEPTDEQVAIKSFAVSFGKSDRLDAEYYRPKYEQAENSILNCGFPTQKLGSLIQPIQNGFDYREFTGEGTPYIRVGDVKSGQIDIEGSAKVSITISDVNKPVGLKIGDILFTRKGSFGNSAVVDKKSVDGIISSEIMLVRLAPASEPIILPEYISLFLNSKFGYLQVERRVHGVAYYSISQVDLAEILIPVMPPEQQSEIVRKVKASFESKEQSQQLLEIAKAGVEKAIEQDETTAINWMQQKLKKLNISINLENSINEHCSN